LNNNKIQQIIQRLNSLEAHLDEYAELETILENYEFLKAKVFKLESKLQLQETSQDLLAK
jgi:hypothetical protein